MKRDGVASRWRWISVFVLGSLVAGFTFGCEEVGLGPEEEPPSRVRELRKPDWKTKEDLPKAAEESGEGVAVEATPVPEEVEDVLEGALAIVMDRYKTTERASERARSVDEVLPDMTAGDVTKALEAIKSGKRLEAEVGMALITGYYTPKQEWMRIDEAYKEFFKSVPELRFDPRYILEHAWTMYKLGKFEKALKRADEAEQYFQNLSEGQSTLEFRARLLELRAWCYEGKFRESISKGEEDETVALWRSRAVQSWEAYRDLLQPFAEKGRSYADRIAMAKDHISGFQSRSD